MGSYASCGPNRPLPHRSIIMAHTFPKPVAWPHAAMRHENANAPAIAFCVGTESGAWPHVPLHDHAKTARKTHETWHLASIRSLAEKNKAAVTSQMPAIDSESEAPLGRLGQFGLLASPGKRYGFALGTRV